MYLLEMHEALAAFVTQPDRLVVRGVYCFPPRQCVMGFPALGFQPRERHIRGQRERPERKYPVWRPQLADSFLEVMEMKTLIVIAPFRRWGWFWPDIWINLSISVYGDFKRPFYRYPWGKRTKS